MKRKSTKTKQGLVPVMARSLAKKRPLGLGIALGLAAMLGVSDASAVRMTLLQDLMKRLDGFVATGNMRSAAVVLNLVKNTGPDEYAKWAEIAEKGRAAAAAGDSAGVKTACKGCHEQYRQAYKMKYGSSAPDEKNPVPVPID